MANSLSQLIADFRTTTAPESITPNSLGYLLQRIADATGATSSDNTNDIIPSAKQHHIECLIYENALYLIGASDLLAEGYVPYIFRPTKNKNRYRDANRPRPNNVYCRSSKGWSLFGSMHAVRIENGKVLFSTNEHNFLHLPANAYSPLPDAYVETRTYDKRTTIGWGKSTILLNDRKKTDGSMRLLRLRFGIGLGKPIRHGIAKITPYNLLTNLAQFTIMFDPVTRQWTFSHA